MELVRFLLKWLLGTPNDTKAIEENPRVFVIGLIVGMLATVALSGFYLSFIVRPETDFLKERIADYQQRLGEVPVRNKYEHLTDRELREQVHELTSDILKLFNSYEIRIKSVPFGSPEWRTLVDEYSKEYAANFQARTFELRDAMLSRLPPLTKEQLFLMSLTSERSALFDPIGAYIVCAHLESLASRLTQNEPNCFWFSNIAVYLGIALPLMLLLILRASLERRRW